jgi:MerR family copper efflux transcriptional regulator
MTSATPPRPRRDATPAAPGALRRPRPLPAEPPAAPRQGPGPLNIGEAAAQTGLSAKMIRHYESIGLIGTAARTEAGYRRYDAQDLRTLRFVRHARELGFGLERIGRLVSLWRDPGRASADVKRIALEHVAELDRQIELLQRMRDALADTADHCRGDRRSVCPILDDLERT